MDVKLSKFNHYVHIDETLVIWNRLRNSIGYLTPFCNSHLDIDSIPEEKINGLMSHGFVIPSNIDEDLLGDYYHEKKINDSSLSLTILASENCNFRCQYCFDEFHRTNINEIVMWDLISYIKRNIGRYTGLNISWFGGEPLLAKDALYTLSDELIHTCKQVSRPYFASITTNGYLLDYETFKKLLQYKVIHYTITIDGTAETHDANRPLRSGGGTFDRIIQNLRNIRDYVKSQQFKIVLRTNITTDILQKFDEYLTFMQAEFGSDRRFTFLFSPVYDWGGSRINEIREKLIYSMLDVYAILLNKDYQLNMESLIGQLGHNICSYARKNTYTIDTCGNVFLCPQARDNPVGKLSNGKIVLDEYKIAYWYSLSSGFVEECIKCEDYAICKGKSCVNNLWRLSKNGKTPHQLNCGREYSNLDEVLKILYKMNKNILIEL